jgi:hypothetical protein
LDVGKRGGMKKKPPEKEKSNGRGGGVLVKKSKLCRMGCLILSSRQEI